MTNNEKVSSTNNSFSLREEDVKELENFAQSSSDELDNKRARALIALHDGATRQQAADAAELTVGQMKYLLSVFRQKGMLLFQQSKEAKNEIVVETNETDAPQKEKVKSKKDKRKKHVLSAAKELKKKKSKKKDKKKKDKKTEKDIKSKKSKKSKKKKKK